MLVLNPSAQSFPISYTVDGVFQAFILRVDLETEYNKRTDDDPSPIFGVSFLPVLEPALPKISPITGPISVGSVNFSDAEIPLQSQPNSFMLANVPNPPGSLILVLRGLVQMIGVDFILSGNIGTYTSTTINPGDSHICWYRY